MTGELIVVVPGIGGSVLADRNDDQPVWDAGIGDIAGLVRHPERLGRDRRLEPVGLTRSTKLLGFTVVPGYENLLRALSTFGTIDDRGDPDCPVPGARVVVIAHSLGGLVARYWMGVMERWPWCRSLLTVATPHRGAPKALDWWVNGPHVAGITMTGPRQLAREWPSVAELLPRYQAIHGPASTWCYPHDVAVADLAGPARRAYELHGQIEQAWADMPRRGPEMQAWLGWSHPTLQSASWDGVTLMVDTVGPAWLEGTGWDRDRGDGTVPAVSAVPIEHSHHAGSLTRVGDRHVPMINSPSVLALVHQYVARSSIEWVRGDEDWEYPPALGLDLGEFHAAGDPIPLEVAGVEVDPLLGGRPVWAALRPSGDDAAEPVDIRLQPGPGTLRGVFPGQAPGLYDITVAVREVPGAGNLRVGDTIAVLDGD